MKKCITHAYLLSHSYYCLKWLKLHICFVFSPMQGSGTVNERSSVWFCQPFHKGQDYAKHKEPNDVTCMSVALNVFAWD